MAWERQSTLLQSTDENEHVCVDDSNVDQERDCMMRKHDPALARELAWWKRNIRTEEIWLSAQRLAARFLQSQNMRWNVRAPNDLCVFRLREEYYHLFIDPKSIRNLQMKYIFISSMTARSVLILMANLEYHSWNSWIILAASEGSFSDTSEAIDEQNHVKIAKSGIDLSKSGRFLQTLQRYVTVHLLASF